MAVDLLSVYKNSFFMTLCCILDKTATVYILCVYVVMDCIRLKGSKLPGFGVSLLVNSNVYGMMFQIQVLPPGCLRVLAGRVTGPVGGVPVLMWQSLWMVRERRVSDADCARAA